MPIISKFCLAHIYLSKQEIARQGEKRTSAMCTPHLKITPEPGTRKRKGQAPTDTSLDQR